MTADAVATRVGMRRRLGWHGVHGRLGVGILVVLVAAALAAPVLAPHAPDASDSTQVLVGPSAEHWFGSDDLGRDVLSRVMYALRVSLVVAVGSVALSLPVGLVIGTLAGYFGRWSDVVLMRPTEMLLAFPALLLCLTLISAFGAGMVVSVVAIAVIYVPVIARVARSSSQVVRSELYIEAAVCRGARPFGIIARHVIPNAVGPVLVQTAILAGVAVQIEAALSFLGLGVQPPSPSLGNMLADGRYFLVQAPWIGIFPGLILAVMVLGFNLVGDTMRRRLDPGGLSR